MAMILHIQLGQDDAMVYSLLLFSQNVFGVVWKYHFEDFPLEPISTDDSTFDEEGCRQ